MARPENVPVFREPLSMDPVVLLGAGSGTGKALAIKLAVSGRQVYAGMTNPEHFESLQAAITEAGGVSAMPLIFDVTDQAQVRRGFAESGLQTGQRVNLIQLVAGGLDAKVDEKEVTDKTTGEVHMEPVTIGDVFGNGMRAIKRGDMTIEDLESTLRGMVFGPNVRKHSVQVNISGPLLFAHLLQTNGNLDHGSTIVTLASSESDKCVPGYQTNLVYEPVGPYKEAADQQLTEFAELIGAARVKVVAPIIDGTLVGRMLQIAARVADKKQGTTTKVFKASIDQVVGGIFSELMRGGDGVSRLETVYIEHDSGNVVYQRPAEWEEKMIPIL